jgi:Fe-S-cluster containining protein
VTARDDNRTDRPVEAPECGVEAVATLHADVDREVATIAGRLGERITCRLGCADCCVDGLTVFEVEAERIRRDTGGWLSGAEPHPEGACAFLDADGGCRIYASRPYVCRTQGLPLRWLDEQDGEVVEYRDICPLNDHGGPIEALVPLDCWSIGPSEMRLVRIQRSSVGAGADRVALRTLFDELTSRCADK